MLRQATNRILLRSSATTSRVFSTEAATIPEVDTTFVEKWKKMIPNLDPPNTPSAYMKPRPPTPSTIPSKLTVNLALPYSSLLASKEGMSTHRCLQVLKMGTVNYRNTLKLQEELVCDRKTQKITDTLLSLQHPPTYTLGKRKTEHNLLVSENELRNMGAELHYTQRGGDITYHGPNQAILYPIISLREIGIGVRNYVEKLEETMIELASIYGVTASRGRKCETGVWVGDGKIGAIGVRIQNGVTSHGLAFNIDPDLNYFKHIVPCGISGKEVTSLKRESNANLPSEEVIQDQLISCFARQFGFSVVVLDKSEMIIVPATTGQMGVLPGHVPTIAELKPGIMSVHKGSDISKYFISGGFAVIHANSYADIVAVEAVPIDRIDPAAVQKGLSEFTQKLSSASTDLEKAEAQIGVDVHSALNAAITG